MTGTLRDLTVNRDGTQNITVTVSEDFTAAFDALKDKPVNIEIKKASKGRSKDANAFCWALCSLIGKALTPPEAKEDVYRAAVKAVGVFTPVMLTSWDFQTVKKRWEENGVGWFVEKADSSEVGRIWVHLYYGTSAYTVDEMKLILDWLIDQCEQMELPIPLSKKEEAELLERWSKK